MIKIKEFLRAPISSPPPKTDTLADRAFVLYANQLNTDRRRLTNPSFERVVSYIDQNYMRRLTLEDVAQHVYLHKTYVSQLFTKHLGISFSTYLENVRINKAKELLHTTDMSIQEVAAAVGYASSSYFSKVFMKRVGIPPTHYRDNMFDK